MRGADGQQPGMFSCVSVEAGVPANRPIRKLPLVGPDAVRGWTTRTCAACNLIRLGGIGAWWDPSPA
ncbi:MAG: hypothetical protein JSS16_05060 [Proteobacteria bacterium]|uniref:hypothetical protein n=1 Tax=Rudaea sp. TaxID=2136325 RepID=UPI001D9C4C46|nr:hypothetical protein [Pseudomonadota bacterium]MBS0567420.1 hypothetical protein [Pseudomonadota bacterium]